MYKWEIVECSPGLSDELKSRLLGVLNGSCPSCGTIAHRLCTKKAGDPCQMHRWEPLPCKLCEAPLRKQNAR
jgi:hypothetical protein